MKKNLTASLLLLFATLLLSAQSQHYDVHPKFPYTLTAEEQLLKHTLPAKAAFHRTPAPPAPVVSVAEFQPMSGVMIAYPLGIPVSLVVQLSQITSVKVLVDDSFASERAATYFSQQGVNMENVDMWQIEHDSYWTRDYGPWFVIDGNDNMSVIDFTYNRPARPDDDASLQYVSNYLDLPTYTMPMVHTGGNYMCNGYGVAASTQLVIEENPDETASSLRQIAQDYLGIDDYMFIDDPMDDYIYHIDCWGKFLGVDKVLIGQVPVTDYRYADYEAAAAVFANAVSPWGNHYQVYRVYTPGGGWTATPYTNSLILNDYVFVPQTGSQWDDEAIAVYQQAMPGYTIVPVMESSYTPWENTDALHCRTHELADKDMLYIKHYPLLGSQYIENNAILQASIKSLGCQDLVPDSVLVFYKLNDEDWQTTPLYAVGGDVWEVSLEGLHDGDSVSYYIFAKDNSGRRECHPYIGAADPHHFTVASTTAVHSSETAVLLYPNPAVNHFVVAGENLSHIKVFNSLGQLVCEQFLSSYTNMMDCSAWTSGIYYLSIDTDTGETITKKLVKCQ